MDEQLRHKLETYQQFTQLARELLDKLPPKDAVELAWHWGRLCHEIDEGISLALKNEEAGNHPRFLFGLGVAVGRLLEQLAEADGENSKWREQFHNALRHAVMRIRTHTAYTRLQMEHGYQETIALLADQFGVDERTIKRRLSLSGDSLAVEVTRNYLEILASDKQAPGLTEFRQHLNRYLEGE